MPNQPTTILNDKAVESLKEDALDFTPYVQALADIVMTGSTPLTIGVFGTWGSGKTSLMRMVKEQVEEKGAVAGWFDAWKYDKEETLWRAFLLSVLFALEDAAKKNEQPTDEIEKLKTLLYQPIDIEKTGGVTIDLVKLGGKAVQGAVQIGLSFIPVGAALGKIVEELQSAGVANLSEGTMDAIQRERIKVHIEQIRFLEQFQERFRKIVAESVVRNNNGRLVVFVDDLDRCLPEKAIEVLESIKLFADAPGCVFMLGLDAEVIARGVEIRYHDYFKDGAKYLEKIIQLPFQIPPVEHSDMQDFVGGLSQNWPHPECPIVFAEGLGNNPRQIKRTINVFLMLWSLAKKREKKLKGEIKPIRLAKIVAIQAVYPELYNFLKETPGYLKDLEDYYQDEAKKQKVEDSTKWINELAKDNPHEVMEVFRKEAEKRGLLEEGIPTQKPEISPTLPPALTVFGNNAAVRHILTLHSPEMAECNFGMLTPTELHVYFTLTRRVETPQVTTELPIEAFEPQMVKIPAGKFLMGSTKEHTEQIVEHGADKDLIEWELPQHEVELSEYFIGKYPVTNAQYRLFIQDTQYRRPQGWDSGSYPPEKSDHPVVNVSWHDTQTYCQWLGQKTGKPYRLPTEAEWEKAARGQDGRIYPWGNKFDSKKANTFEIKIGGITPVGQFSQAGGDSPYGCADMAGNVWNWCNDRFDENEYKTRLSKTVKDPLGPQTGDIHVVRGGSFSSHRRNARCARRGRENTNFYRGNIGFRVCLAPVPGIEPEG